MSWPDSHSFNVGPAVIVLTGLATGIAADRFLHLSWSLSLAVCLISLCLWCVCQVTRSNQWMAAGCLLLAVVFAGSFWHHGRWNWYSPRDLKTYCGSTVRPVCVRVRILGEGRMVAKPEDAQFDPLPATEKTAFTVAPLEIRNGRTWEKVYGVSRLVVHQRVDHVVAGDDVLVFGRLAPIGKPTVPGQFNFQDYYRATQTLSVLHAFYSDALTVERRASLSTLGAVRSCLRKKLDDLFWTHINPEYAGFASAILLGNRQQLTMQTRDRFVSTGTAHLLAISGLHVGILAGVFLIAYRLGALDRRWALLLTIFFVVFYAWLVEFRPPVTRAAILLTLFCLGRLIGRAGFEFNLLAVAGILVLTINPGDLFGIGPQLSFLAVASLILFKDWIFPAPSDDPIDRLIRNTRSMHQRWMHWIGRRSKQAILVSGLIWLVGLPLVASNFHVVTPIALLINPLVLVPTGIALFSGLGVCLFGFWAPALADLCGWTTAQSLHLVSTAINCATVVPGGHWWTAGPGPKLVAVFYMLLLLLTLVPGHHRARWLLLIWSVWLFCGWLPLASVWRLIDGTGNRVTTCTFLDMGHGSSVLLQFPNGKNLLYDAGSMSSAHFAAEQVSSAVWSEQIEHLDAIVISHPDLDHFNAVPELVRRFSVGVVYLGKPESGETGGCLEQLLQDLNAEKIPVRYLAWNDSATIDEDLELSVILPPDDGFGESDNADSLVIIVQAGRHKLVLPGDLEGSGMQLLLKMENVDCDVALMPHHGSRLSWPREFIQWCRPEFAVISAGRNRTDDEMLQQLRDLNCQPLVTGGEGSIRFRFAQDRVVMSVWNGSSWQPRR